MQKQLVVVLGASAKPERYSNQVLRLLLQYGHRVIPVHPRLQQIEGIPTVNDMGLIKEPVDTLTLYLGPQRSAAVAEKIAQLHPRRVIFNPGTESPALADILRRANIHFVYDCTLMMLQSGRFAITTRNS